jgi:hypothetical protein
LQAKQSPTVFGLVKKMDYFFVKARFVESVELPKCNERGFCNDTIEHGSLLMQVKGWKSAALYAGKQVLSNL